MQYSEFIKTKQCASIKSGFDVDANNLNHALFDWQKAIVRWSLAQGRAALFAACGMGKSAMQLEWASQVHRHTSGDVLILAPLAVSSQTVREGKKFGIHINLCRSVNDWKPGINITNYEKLDKFNVSDLAGVVLDECFPPDTPIDVLTTNGETVKYIKDIQRNDTILNASGVDHVTSICKRQIDRAIQISVGGQRITSSENHPYFTMSGWKPAQDLQTGDHIMATKAAMRLVRNNIHPEVCRTEDAEILRKILLGEMENERSGTMRKNPHKRRAAEKGKSKSRVVQKKISSCIKRTGTYQEFKSNEQSRDSTKGIRDPASYGAQTECAGRERKTLASTTTNVTGCVGGRLVSRICSGHGEPDGGIPNTLQDRHSEPVHDDSDRSGRSIALQPEGDRLEKGYETDFVRVDGVEVLEQGHPVLEKYRDESGLVYFYDIEASRHPSFSINGLLVHNSGILKNYSGKIRNNIIDKFVNTPYKLACSATPAPNDHMELGNHAEFLNVMTRTEMLATYFIHDSSDTSKWRLKGHVKEKLFWKWMCSWAIMLEKPSDIGFSDSGYELPILKMHEHFVKSPLRSGEMFVTEATDLISRRKARNESIDLRVNKAKEIIAESGESPWLCWCNLNDESTKLKKAIDGSIEVAGAHSNEYKENALMNFAIGNTDCMVSKPKIAGHGMNFQCCSNAIFVGLSDSFEAMYQAIRRCWRFGQKNPVDIHIVLSEREGSVLNNIKQKEAKHQKMINGMVKNMSLMIQENLSQSTKSTDEDIVKHEGRNWTLYNGDCVSVVRNQPENSIDYTIFSPPFASLYTYSDSPMDMGNSKTN
ncbi:MAG: hypothetical protein U9M89_00800, partial [Patescibacteria group bacterium]|nr:hypothetical protein [Patescibacteria group bacterium]